jgi:hypothetical protein
VRIFTRQQHHSGFVPRKRTAQTFEDPMSEREDLRRQGEVVDVQFLDVLAQVGAVLRHGRELQRDARRVRGVSSSGGPADQRPLGVAIRERVEQMHADCTTLCSVVEELRTSVSALERPIT